MATIKVKKKMNLAQLIEWGLKNEITSKEYTCNNKDGYKSVIFSTTGTVHLNSFQTYLADDKYTVEVEEEIDEDTELKELFLITNNSISSERYYNYSINDVLSNNEGYYEEIAILILKPEPLIIWTKEKGLVE